jgi:hypothetical protein
MSVFEFKIILRVCKMKTKKEAHTNTCIYLEIKIQKAHSKNRN